ncbi:hypothetical protein [Streptomyces sp. NPDC003032]
MTIRPRLVVTERQSEGNSVVASDEQPASISIAAAPGTVFYMLWGTEDGGTTVGTDPRQPRTFPFPGVGGTRLLLARYAPQSPVAEPIGDPERLVAGRGRGEAPRADRRG